jgi:hypothetical protein
MQETQEQRAEAGVFCPHGRRVFDFDGSYGNLNLTPLATCRGERPQTPFNRTVAFISCKSCNCLSMPELLSLDPPNDSLTDRERNQLPASSALLKALYEVLAPWVGVIFLPSLLYRTRGGGARLRRPSRERTLLVFLSAYTFVGRKGEMVMEFVCRQGSSQPPVPGGCGACPEGCRHTTPDTVVLHPGQTYRTILP